MMLHNCRFEKEEENKYTCSLCGFFVSNKDTKRNCPILVTKNYDKVLSFNSKHPSIKDCSQVGSIIRRYLIGKGIRSANGGCNCDSIEAKMNVRTSKEIREKIDFWTKEMHISAKMWRKQQQGIWRVFQVPKFPIRRLILWACEEAEK